MTLTIADQYYLKAKDDYSYDMEAAMESLNYALGYDPDHPGANHLMAHVYMDQLRDYDLAVQCFERALASDPNNLGVCRSYSYLLIELRKFKRAQKLIDYSYTITGVDLAVMRHAEGLLNEYQKNFDQAIRLYQLAKEEIYNDSYMDYLNEEIERVEGKIRETKSWNYCN